ncbi:MAG: hypothetical protein LBE21_10005, partial [Pseudomonadales bacterium]|nr:hypothetical protein [Pseudomonadales bacterium]
MRSKPQPKLTPRLVRQGSSLWRLGALALCGCVAQAQAAETLEAATEAAIEDAATLDWVPLDQLTEEQRALVEGVCCGLYIAPTFPEAAALEPGAVLFRGTSSDTAIGAADTGIVDVDEGFEVMQQDIVIQAGNGSYDRNSQVFTLGGNIRLRQDGMLLTGSRASVDQRQGRSEISGASYLLHDIAARGSAQILVYTDADGVITIDNGVYTRCEPGDNSW